MDEERSSTDEWVIHVCVTCRRSDDPEGAERAGAALHRALIAAHSADQTQALRIEPVSCLSGCKRSCTIALTGPGRWTYVYGDLDPDLSVPAILDGARRYGATPDGLVPWRERPEAFRRGAIARIPPMPTPSPDRIS